MYPHLSVVVCVMGKCHLETFSIEKNDFFIPASLSFLIFLALNRSMPVCSHVISKYFATPRAVAPLSIGFPRQECWSELPFPTAGHLPDSGIEPESPALAGGFFTWEAPFLSPSLLPLSPCGLFPFSLPSHVFCVSHSDSSLPLSPFSLPLSSLPVSESLFTHFPLPFSLCPPSHTLASSTPHSQRPVALCLSPGTISCLPAEARPSEPAGAGTAGLQVGEAQQVS